MVPLTDIEARYGFDTKSTDDIELCCETASQDLNPYWGFNAE